METHALPEELQHVARLVAHVADLIRPFVKTTKGTAMKTSMKLYGQIPRSFNTTYNICHKILRTLVLPSTLPESHKK